MRPVWLALLSWALTPCLAHAQSQNQAPWFGIRLPPSFGVEPAVIVGDRTPRAVANRARDPLSGPLIQRDVATIVAFSQASRDEREVGTGQLWGRISGLPSSARTIDWATEQFRRAGITEVRTQIIHQEANASLWLPLSWEVRLLGAADFGAGTTDVVLESAMPLRPSRTLDTPITAPLVFVGGGQAALLERLDVRDKIAVQLVVPQGHLVFERSAVTSRAQELTKRGALAVLNLVRLPGNERSFDFSNCGNPCFNIGGRDGWFLENVFERAARAGVQDKLRARLSLTSESRSGLTAKNAVAVILGKSDEAIIVDAHADAWFDGAGDNADGLAVMLALARHFVQPKYRVERTLVFVASAGHHTPGINGPRSFVRANPELVKNAVLVINIEHVAQRNFAPARSTYDDGYRQAVADSGEAPITFGVTNSAPFLNELAALGVARFGVNLVSERSTLASGETGGFGDVSAPKVTIMQAPPLYHTTGETLEVISTPGLERMARFLAMFIAETAKAPRDKLGRQE